MPRKKSQTQTLGPNFFRVLLTSCSKVEKICSLEENLTPLGHVDSKMRPQKICEGFVSRMLIARTITKALIKNRQLQGGIIALKKIWG